MSTSLLNKFNEQLARLLPTPVKHNIRRNDLSLKYCIKQSMSNVNSPYLSRISFQETSLFQTFHRTPFEQARLSRHNSTRESKEFFTGSTRSTYPMLNNETPWQKTQNLLQCHIYIGVKKYQEKREVNDNRENLISDLQSREQCHIYIVTCKLQMSELRYTGVDTMPALWRSLVHVGANIQRRSRYWSTSEVQLHHYNTLARYMVTMINSDVLSMKWLCSRAMAHLHFLSWTNFLSWSLELRTYLFFWLQELIFTSPFFFNNLNVNLLFFF